MRTLQIFGLISIVMGVGCAAFGVSLFAATYRSAQLSARLVPVDAVITESRLVNHRDGAEAVIRFRYRVDGKVHISSSRVLQGGISNPQATVDSFPVGIETVAYYDVEDPASAVLTREFSPLVSMCALWFVMLSPCTLLFTLRARVYTRRPRDVAPTRAVWRPGWYWAAILGVLVIAGVVAGSILMIAYVRDIRMFAPAFVVSPLCYYGASMIAAPFAIMRGLGMVRVRRVTIESVVVNDDRVTATIHCDATHDVSRVKCTLCCDRPRSDSSRGSFRVQRIHSETLETWSIDRVDDGRTRIVGTFPGTIGNVCEASRLGQNLWTIFVRVWVGRGVVKHEFVIASPCASSA